MKISTFAIVAILAFAIRAARAEDFDFTFSGAPDSGSPGTVSGEILGLSPNGMSAPTGVLLFSDSDNIPAGDLYALGWFHYGNGPQYFTVSNGEVTDYNFNLFSANTNEVLDLGLAFDGAQFNLMVNYLTDQWTGNAAGLGGVTFTPVDVPEPGSLAMLLLGVGLVMRFRASGRKSSLLLSFKKEVLS